MRDYISIGSTPCDEDYVQVSREDTYLDAMRGECIRFRELIRHVLGPEPEGARLGIKSFEHDFGTHLEVVCHYDDAHPEAVTYALKCEAEAPMKWELTPAGF